MCEAALRRGLREICFTEHVDWVPWEETRELLQSRRLRPRRRSSAGQSYAGRLSVRIGLEIE